MRYPRAFSSVALFALAGMLCLFAFANAGCRKHATAFGPLRPCKLPGLDDELLCGKLTVFENRATRTGRTIDLNVVVLPALDGNHTETPLFHLEGGPAVAATGVAYFYAKEGIEYRRHRPIDSRIASVTDSINNRRDRRHRRVEQAARDRDAARSAACAIGCSGEGRKVRCDA
jgi:hypothetical protein